MPVTHTLNAVRELDADLIRRIAAGENLAISAGPGGAGRRVAAPRRGRARPRRAGLRGQYRHGGAVRGPAHARGAARAPAAPAAGPGRGRAAVAALREVRALYAVRLRTFLSGDAGVSAELCQRLADVPGRRDRGGPARCRPRRRAARARSSSSRTRSGRWPGSARCWPAATLTPAAEVVWPVVGLHTRSSSGRRRASRCWPGVPGATALSLLAGGRGGAGDGHAGGGGGLSIAAAGAPGDPYGAACARADDVLGAVLARLRGLAGSRPARMLQAPVSFRVAGPLLAR